MLQLVVEPANMFSPPSPLQSVLGAEGLSLAFRHIVSSLLRFCSQQPSEELLHQVIVCVGYFTVNHPDNQVRAAEGTCPVSPRPGGRGRGRGQLGLGTFSFMCIK